MNRIAVACIASLLVVMFAGCGKDPELQNNQERNFINYFKSRGYDSLVRGGVFVHISNADRAGRDSEPELESGDSIYYYYELYSFIGFSDNAKGNPSYVLATNNPGLAYSIPGLDPRYLDLEIAGARLGRTDMVEGLRRGLPGSRQRDSVWLYVPSDMAYGEPGLGVVDANTPVVFMVSVEKVKKQE